jgi:DNA (cytosine-5)-methyltransferase 1
VFAGIGGFDLGMEEAGWKTLWQVEREPFCLAVLATKFPAGAASDGYFALPWVDLICAGVPCQDVSVAGKRAGLAGQRTGLFYEFARILCELRPTWFVFENVPGLLSSNEGRDFAEVLRVLMVECGYGVSWRVLDSQFFGVAQRRRRLFVVGCFGKPCPAAVLFDKS